VRARDDRRGDARRHRYRRDPGGGPRRGRPDRRAARSENGSEPPPRRRGSRRRTRRDPRGAPRASGGAGAARLARPGRGDGAAPVARRVFLHRRRARVDRRGAQGRRGLRLNRARCTECWRLGVD
jgi:hypothetical protein